MSQEQKMKVLGGILLVSSLFILLTIIYPQSTGFLGYWLVQIGLGFLFGKGIFCLPLYLGAIAALLLTHSHVVRFRLRMIGLQITFFTTIIALEMFLSPTAVVYQWPPFTQYGGFVGNVLAVVIQKSVGLVGAYFFILIAFLTSLFMVFNKGIADVFNFGKTVWAVSAPAERPVRQMVKPQQVAAAPVAAVPHGLHKPDRKQGLFQVLKGTSVSTEVMPVQAAGAPVVPAVPSIDTQVKPRLVRQIMQQPTPVVQKRSPLANILPRSSNYQLPPASLLRAPIKLKDNQKQLELQFKHDKDVLEKTLASFNVEAKVSNISHGPTVTRYELMPSPGVRVNRIANLADDISLTMASTVRIEAPVPGKSVVGIEVPNAQARPVNLSELTQYAEFMKHPLTVALGLDIGGNPIYCNINEMPHLLVAGATGSGKSVCINTLIMSILLKASPKEVKFLMIDPKRVELAHYNDLPHLVAPVVNEPNVAPVVLKLWAIKEMEKRYEIFSRIGVRNLEGYNAYAVRNKGKTIQIMQEVEGETKQVPYVIDHLPYVVIIIDELADLMMVSSRDVEGAICRIAQMARATGMHLVIATQRPSVDVITGLIKANVPSRIAFAVGSHIDSRTIIDGQGAEKLLGKGDMLYSPVGARHLTRVQGVYVSDEEILSVTQHIRRQAPPNYAFDINKLKLQAQLQEQKTRGGAAAEDAGNSPNQREDGRDVLFDDAANLIAHTGRKSISFIQRKFRIGYNRAARIMEELVEAGMVSAE